MQQFCSAISSFNGFDVATFEPSNQLNNIMKRLLSIAVLLATVCSAFASSTWYAPFFRHYSSVPATVKGRVIERRYIYEGTDEGRYSFTILVTDNFGLCVPDTISLVYSFIRYDYSRQYTEMRLNDDRKRYLTEPASFYFQLDLDTDYFLVFSRDRSDQSYRLDRHFVIIGDSTYCNEGHFTERLSKKNKYGMTVKSFERKLKKAYRLYINSINRWIAVRQHDYVDLGLSVKWATCNVGADEPENDGNYYSWGERNEKGFFKWNYYWWCYDSCSNLAKYNTNPVFGPVDSLTVLEPDDDVAHVRWGGSWRMPSKEEWKELQDNCIWTWDSVKTVFGFYRKGYRIKGCKPGYTDRSIFLPAAGYRGDTSDGGEYFKDRDSCCCYWVRDLDTDNPICSNGRFRFEGLTIRPVCP